MHGKHFTRKVFEFGEMVYAKALKKVNRKRSLKARAILGIWLGIEPRTGENRVALVDGGPVVKVRTVIRVPDSAKWNAEQIAKLVATPRQPNPRDKEQEEEKPREADEEGGGTSLKPSGQEQHARLSPKFLTLLCLRFAGILPAKQRQSKGQKALY